jgi:ABC-2 type transport system ATP-binding protein
MSAPLLAVDSISKAYAGRTVLDGLSLTIDRGEVFGLLGPNGAGKTTTISIVCGLQAADAGGVVIGGERVDPRSTATRRHLGYVPQEIALWGGLSARQNVAFFGRLQGLRGKALKQAVERALDTVGLMARADDRVETFSGGMQRRTNIAVALVHDPELLVLDEPTVGVDPQSRNAMLEQIRALARNGCGVLFASHYLAEIEQTCTNVGILDHGQMIAEGAPSDLVERLDLRTSAEMAEHDDRPAGTLEETFLALTGRDTRD